MIVCNGSIPLLKNSMREYFRNNRVAAVFVIAINIISVWQWIMITKLEWFEDYFVPIVTGALGGSLIQQYALVLLLLILRERMKHGSAFKKLKLPKLR